MADLGCTAVLPRLYGEPGRPVSGAYVTRSLAPACISREFHCFAMRKTSVGKDDMGGTAVRFTLPAA